jgi:hypothetical protein
MVAETDLEQLRDEVARTIGRSTALLADLTALDDRLQILMPELARLTESEREEFVARLCGYDTALTDRLRTLVESLADLVAGLTATDGGGAWLRDHLARLESGEAPEAA